MTEAMTFPFEARELIVAGGRNRAAIYLHSLQFALAPTAGTAAAAAT